jgi:hypothetical protein
VDNKPPKTYVHLQVKLKKLQIEEERLAVVERDNRVLLEKMTHIMRTSGRVDNHNDYEHKRCVRPYSCPCLAAPCLACAMSPLFRVAWIRTPGFALDERRGFPLHATKRLFLP